MGDIILDISDCFDEDLIEELESRNYEVYEQGEFKRALEDEVNAYKELDGFSIKRDFLGYELRAHLLKIAGMGGWVSDDQLFDRLRELLK